MFITAEVHPSLWGEVMNTEQNQLLARHRDTRVQSISHTVPRQGCGGTTAPVSLSIKIMPLLWQCLFHWHAGTSLFCRLLLGNQNWKWFWTFNVTMQNVRCGRKMPNLLHTFSFQLSCKQHWRSWLSYPIFTKEFRFGTTSITHLLRRHTRTPACISSGCRVSTAQTYAQNRDWPHSILSAALT